MEESNTTRKPTIPTIPTELPSYMEQFSGQIVSLEISARCYDEEFAAERESRMKAEIASGLKWAVEMGIDYSNSRYQNVRREGSVLTFEYYRSLLTLLFSHDEPLFKYNQYEVPRVDSVTVKIGINQKIADTMDFFQQSLQKAMEEGSIDSYSIEGLNITITSSAPDPFRKIFNAYSQGESSCDKYLATKESVKNTTSAMNSTANAIMGTIAVIVAILFLLKFLL